MFTKSVKKWICSVCLFVLLTVISCNAIQLSAIPVLTSPGNNSEMKYSSPVTIKWNCSDSGITKYLVTVRKYTLDDRQNGGSGTQIIINHNVGMATSYVIPGSMIERRCMYKFIVCAQKSDGTQLWAEPRYFYVGTHNGVNLSSPLSFNVWSGFATQTKAQIYDSAMTWQNNVSYVFFNSTNFINEVSSNTRSQDSINSIVGNYLDPDEPVLMLTYNYRNSSGILTEADIVVNKSQPWTNSPQVGFYDVQNVMTHEMGHVVGLCDKYETWSTLWTMYGYSNTNEDLKRTLHIRDMYDLLTLYEDND